MLVTKKQAKEIVTQWGWKRLPKEGREYIHVCTMFTEYLSKHEGFYKFYFEPRKI